MRTKVAAFERRFVCIDGCTKCCTRSGEVVLTRDDIARLSQHLRLEERDFMAAFVDGFPGCYRLRMSGKGRSLRCPFLAGNTRHGFCSVHEAKPVQCRTYPLWPGIADQKRRWNREASFCPGIGKGRRLPDRFVQIQLGAAAQAGVLIEE